ncbi:MAG: response regulator [SAR324 cluster bacterium]|nr:response regulator [SAR324 cluster bacterium]
MNVLIIEDEAAFAEVLENRLIESGKHSVQIALNGEEGWDLYSASATFFDIILTDFKMPRLSGIDLLERIRNNNFQIPVVIMTGYGDLDICIKALQLGAFDFLIKPFSINEFDSLILKLENLYFSEQQLKNLVPLMSEKINIQICSQIDLISPLVNHLHNQYYSLCKLHHINSHQIDLSLYEALTNAIVHGNFEISSSLKEESWDQYETMVKTRGMLPEYKNKPVLIRCEVNSRELVFEVEDKGEGFENGRRLKSEESLTILNSGRGIVLIRSSMDEVSWNQSGNCIRMVKFLKH